LLAKVLFSKTNLQQIECLSQAFHINRKGPKKLMLLNVYALSGGFEKSNVGLMDPSMQKKRLFFEEQPQNT